MARLQQSGHQIGCIYDIGASICAWSQEVQAVCPQARFEMFEPLAGCHPELDARSRADEIVNGCMHPVALADVTGVAKMKVLGGHGVGSTTLIVDSDFRKSTQIIDVPAFRLDDYVAAQRLMPPDFIKLRTQASELRIIRGATQTLRQASFILVATWNRRVYGPETPLFHELAAVLFEQDYLLHEFLSLDEGRDPDGTLRWFDAVFINKRIGKSVPTTQPCEVPAKVRVADDWRRSLRERFPFPDGNLPPSYYFSLDGGGRNIIEALIAERKMNLLVEVGSFLCGSSIQWLRSSPTVEVIGIDPWKDKTLSAIERYTENPLFDNCFAEIQDRNEFLESLKANGIFASAMANVKEFRGRFYPFVGTSPQALHELSAMGCVPDMIYFDSDKVLDDLKVAHMLFPGAILAGDDWTWGADQGYPVRQSVTTFCNEHGYRVQVERATWIIHRD